MYMYMDVMIHAYIVSMNRDGFTHVDTYQKAPNISMQFEAQTILDG